MKIISMKQLREKFNPVRKGLGKGEEYLLLYRSKPLAMLIPYQNSNSSQVKKSLRPTLKPTTITVQTPPQPEPQPAVVQQPDSPPPVEPAPKENKSILNRFGMKSMLMPK
jgi:hypothetical protein